MPTVNRRRRGRSAGQALLESALLIPFLLALTFNAINFGYFYYVALNMSAATRSGALYAILGPETPVEMSFPPAGTETTIGSVSYIIYQDMKGALPSASVDASVQVCSQSVGTTGDVATGTLKASCTSFGSATFGTGAPPDPEVSTTSFILNQVDISYSFKPLIPGTPFGAVLLATPICSSTGGQITCTFHRKALMRAM